MGYDEWRHIRIGAQGFEIGKYILNFGTRELGIGHRHMRQHKNIADAVR